MLPACRRFNVMEEREPRFSEEESSEEFSGNAILLELTELTAASVAVAMADYSALLPVIDRLPRASNRDALVQELAQSARDRAHSLLILSRSLVQYGRELDELTIEEDPRILLPLLHALADSFAIIALSNKEEDLQVHLLLDDRGLDKILTPKVVQFIRAWGEERATQALSS